MKKAIIRKRGQAITVCPLIISLSAAGKEYKMRQSANSTSKKITALYLRISREDKEDDRVKDESNSITNQRELLTDIAKKMQLSSIREYVEACVII